MTVSAGSKNAFNSEELLRFYCFSFQGSVYFCSRGAFLGNQGD